MLPIIVLVLCSCESSLDSSFENNFVKVNGYYASNRAHLNKPTDYFVIDNQAAWDSTFFVIYDHVDPATITKVDFKDYFAICVVKWENKLWEMEPVELSFNNSEINYKYEAKYSRENMSWTAAVANIIMVKKCSYQNIKFYENDSLVFTYDK